MDRKKITDRVARRIMAAKKKGDRIEVGDRVEAQTRKGVREMTVTEVKPGRKWYTVSLSDPALGEGYWTYKVPSPYYYDARGITYLGKARKKKLQKDIEKVQGVKSQREQSKRERSNENYDVLRKLNVEVGDVVLYEYRNGTRNETVAKINYKTGKIGIPKKGYDPGLALLLQKRIRDVRWLNATGIKKIVTKAADTYEGEKSYPYGRLDSKYITKMQKDGWTQITYGREFIEYSAVIGRSPRDARNGKNYDGADKKVYFDPKLGVFWRKTGTFD